MEGQYDKTELMFNHIDETLQSRDVSKTFDHPKNGFFRLNNAGNLWLVNDRPCMTQHAKDRLNLATGGTRVTTKKKVNGVTIEKISVDGGAYSENDFARCMNYCMAFSNLPRWVQSVDGFDLLRVDSDHGNNVMRNDGKKWVNNNATRSVDETGKPVPGNGASKVWNIAHPEMEKPKSHDNGNTTNKDKKYGREYWLQAVKHAQSNFNKYDGDMEIYVDGEEV